MYIKFWNVEFFFGNTNIYVYLHCLSFISMKVAQIVEICFWKEAFILHSQYHGCWWLVSPGHYQQWYWPKFSWNILISASKELTHWMKPEWNDFQGNIRHSFVVRFTKLVSSTLRLCVHSGRWRSRFSQIAPRLLVSQNTGFARRSVF